MLAQVKAGFLGSAAAVGGGGPAVCTFQTSAVDGSNATTYTFSSQDIGTAAPDRNVIVVINEGANIAINSVTVAGQSCSSVYDQGGSGHRQAVFVTDAPVTSGTTADIVVTLAASGSRCGIAVYSVTGLSSRIPVDTDLTTADNTGVTVDVAADGFVLAASSNQQSGSTHTWTNVSENYDQTIEASAHVMSGGLASTPSAGTLTVTCDASSILSFRVIVVSFR